MITTLITIALAWTVLTLFVEIAGPKKDAEFGEKGAALKTLIVYDLDPFYNLDEQVCKSFAKALAATGEYVKVVSVATAKETDASQFNLYVFCPNTYNWLPDWSITRYIKKENQY